MTYPIFSKVVIDETANPGTGPWKDYEIWGIRTDVLRRLDADETESEIQITTYRSGDRKLKFTQTRNDMGEIASGEPCDRSDWDAAFKEFNAAVVKLAA